MLLQNEVDVIVVGCGGAGMSAAVMAAEAIAAALDREVHRRAIDVALNTRVERLWFDTDRTPVVGVRAGGTDVHARPLFAGESGLTTGGFGANLYLLHRWYPEATAHGDAAWYSAVVTARATASRWRNKWALTSSANTADCC